MTKRELLLSLEPFDDDINILLESAIDFVSHYTFNAQEEGKIILRAQVGNNRGLLLVVEKGK